MASYRYKVDLPIPSPDLLFYQVLMSPGPHLSTAQLLREMSYILSSCSDRCVDLANAVDAGRIRVLVEGRQIYAEGPREVLEQGTWSRYLRPLDTHHPKARVIEVVPTTFDEDYDGG